MREILTCFVGMRNIITIFSPRNLFGKSESEKYFELFDKFCGSNSMKTRRSSKRKFNTPSSEKIYICRGLIEMSKVFFFTLQLPGGK